MPVYEYRCKNCGRVTEVLECVGRDKELPRCIHCGGDALTKMMSAYFMHGGSKRNGGGSYSVCSEGGGRKEGIPEDCYGNWPTNDDYIRLQID